MKDATLHLHFAHPWTAEILASRPLILPKHGFVYPNQAEEVERGAMEVLVKTAQHSFLATCALGFADPAAPSGVWSCPNPDTLCAVSGGYAYLIDTTEPQKFVQVEYRPVLAVHALPEQNLLLFAGHHSLTAWGAEGKAWQTARLSWEGVTIDRIEGTSLTGTGWDMITDRDVSFTIDLRTGDRIG